MIQINLHLDGKLYRVLGRRGLLAAALLVPAIALAAPLTAPVTPAASVPNTFQAGTTISAAQVNANFAALTTGLDALDTRLTVLEAKKSLPSAASVFAYVGTSAGDGAITKTFNSTAGTNSYTGTGGLYTVTLGGIDCGATTGTGIAVAQAAGASGISCRVNGDWGNVGANCRVYVACFTGAGASTATPFSLLYAR